MLVMAVVVVVVVGGGVVVVPVVHMHGRDICLGRSLMMKPCVSCVVGLQRVCMHHLRCSPKAARYTRYILVPQKGSKITLL